MTCVFLFLEGWRNGHSHSSNPYPHSWPLALLTLCDLNPSFYEASVHKTGAGSPSFCPVVQGSDLKPALCEERAKLLGSLSFAFYFYMVCSFCTDFFFYLVLKYKGLKSKCNFFLNKPKLTLFLWPNGNTKPTREMVSILSNVHHLNLS